MISGTMAQAKGGGKSASRVSSGGRKAPKAAPRATAKPASRPKTAAAAPARTLTEIGRDAQRAALLEELERQGWNLSRTAAALGLTGPSNVTRALKTLGLEDEYEAAKARGDIAPGRPT